MYYPELSNCLKQSPRDIATQLRPSGILATGDLEFLSNPHNNCDEKAERIPRRILGVVMNQVKSDPHVYHTFMKALKAAGDWTKTVVTKLARNKMQFYNNRIQSKFTDSDHGYQTEHGALPCTHSSVPEKHGIIYKGNPSLLTVAIQVAFVCKALAVVSITDNSP